MRPIIVLRYEDWQGNELITPEKEMDIGAAQKKLKADMDAFYELPEEERDDSEGMLHWLLERGWEITDWSYAEEYL